MYTRNTNEIWVDENFFDSLVKRQCHDKIEEAAKKLNEYAAGLKKELDDFASNIWIKIEDKDIYYIQKHHILIPDITSFKCSSVNEDHFIYMFSGYSGRIINEYEAYDLFYANKNTNVFFVDDTWFTSFGDNHCVVRYKTKEGNEYECINSNGNISCCYKSLFNNCHTCSWGYGIKIPVFDLEKKSVMENMITYNLLPEKLSTSSKSLLKIIRSLYSAGYIQINEDLIYFTDTFADDVLNDKISELFGISLKKESVAEKIKDYAQFNTIKINENFRSQYIKKLLMCDKIRAEIDEYDQKQLTDPNLGMWELWDDGQHDNNLYKIKTDMTLVARNPVCDVKEDGIVGIDFGTKSTIVVYQDGTDVIKPMRIGMGRLSLQIEPEQYENPTVMEIKNLEHFLRCYNGWNGRPQTEWADLTVSHTAYSSMTSGKISDNFYSYFYDLKQWCANQNRNHIMTIIDQCGNKYELSPYISDNDNIFDPIEVYAYYLGMFINNMRNGIYLDYLLSFPITYEKELKQKIISSFERGIKKSLPQSVINDSHCMDIFSVGQGVSEPIAYAITAFTEYGLKPTAGEEMLYGVFDFGGGTTDFNFGTYRRADVSIKKKYDYVITHQGSGGDKYLGGENLLELLAFEIFKANYKRLLKRKDGLFDFNGAEFTLPPECDTFLGSETLISVSQKAKRNTKQLIEKLRPYWENIDFEYTVRLPYDSTPHKLNNVKHKELDEKSLKIIDNIKKGFIRVDLFDNSGQLIPDFELDIYNEDLGIDINLEEILEKRIEKGVRQFFNALSHSFEHRKIIQTNGIEIFLAGNSGKSPILKKLFDKYIRIFSRSDSSIIEPHLFRIYPSLGTPEAAEIQERNGIHSTPGELSGPTGKTGVAYGLIKGRTGSRIKVVSEMNDDNDLKFNYYLGHCEDDIFITDISENNKVGAWTEFTTADISRIEIYYTDLPEAAGNRMPVNSMNKKIIRLKNTFDDASIYIRILTHSSIEYVVSRKGEIERNIYLTEICRIDFS